MSVAITSTVAYLPVGKREQTKVQKRQAILDAAREVFGEAGLRDRDGARHHPRAGLAAGHLLQLLPSKGGSVRALSDDGARRLRPDPQGPAWPRGTVSKAFVRLAIAAYFEFLADEAQATGSRADPAGEPHVHIQGETPEMAAVFAEVRDALFEAIADRQGPAADPDYMAAACIAIAREVGDKMLERRPIDTAAPPTSR
jgi:hypothetical protein